MNFTFTKEQEQLREEVSQWLEKELTDSFLDQMMDIGTLETIAINSDFGKKLGQKGWAVLTWPKKYGGHERSSVDQSIVDELVAYYKGPVLPYYLGSKLVGPIILRFGTEEQKDKYLPEIAAGKVDYCQGFSEPDAGSDLSSLKTRAVKDNDYYIINGEKVFQTAAHIADYCLVVARTNPDVEKHRGLSLFIVDMKSPGISVRPLPEISGCHRFNRTFFDNVRVHKDCLIGKENDGFRQMVTLLNSERASSVRPAYCRRILEELIEYAKTTERGGRPLAEDKLIRNEMMQLAVEIEVCQLLVYHIASMQDQKKMVAAEGSMAKVLSESMEQRLGNTGMRLLGLHGQLERGSKWTPLKGRIERLYLHNAGAYFGGGSPEIQKTTIATVGLGLPRDRA